MNVLKTNTASYLFDTSNPELILKQKGKFSSVYLGYQLPEKLPVVIKILNSEVAEKPYGLKSFIKEASYTLLHTNLQKTIEYFTDGTNHYLIKEYLPGKTLRQLLNSKNKFSTTFYCKCIVEVLSILDALHAKGIYHCDIRPDNILIVSNDDLFDTEKPTVYLLDLGLAKTVAETESVFQSPFSLIYSPPEQLLNYYELIGAPSDIFSTGITLYECVTGLKPFQNENPELIMHLQLNSEIENKNIPKPLFDILLKATAKYRFNLPPAQLEEEELISNLKNGLETRYQSAAEMRAELLIVLASNTIEKEMKWNWLKRIFN
jgi:serine/threonine-protein kinase